MLDRYPAPAAQGIFGDQARIDRWTRITTDRMREAWEDDGSPGEFYAPNRIEFIEVHDREQKTGHDLVAFLQVYEDSLGGMATTMGKYLHFGLTSSDVVDTAHFQALWTHATLLQSRVRILLEQMNRWDRGHQSTQRLGRTHGQVAEPTTWRDQMMVWGSAVQMIDNDISMLITRRWPPVKWPGATGQNRLRKSSPIGAVVSTQVIHRDWQMQWATLYLRLACSLENLALQVRLAARAEIGEVREGAERIGSSAMPHKHNPIQSERICGLARVARGHFSAIAESTALWEDRDLTNSAVERTAVPDLAATVEYMTNEMAVVFRDLGVNTRRMRENLEAHPEAWSSVFQGLAQKHFRMGPTEAARFVRKVFYFSSGSHSGVIADWFGWEYPLPDGFKAEFRKDLFRITGLHI